ncbi:hypothetical protein LSH36_2779g00004 [Paralvinella palmiformis]|uniref:SWIM-type domain-containing protein n=1 Tax=Paralvinella palmiformis TaxID=53620 RepID=A0AAD9IR84_9ANNE|nr:hypothetical protein LSH36_2779g00004 [Paralvinella palmiformis]
MSTPDLLSYQQLPSVTEESITVYMQLFDADMSSKPEDMYRSKFLSSIRNPKYGAYTFVCGRVCAELTKSTVYTVDIKLEVCGVLQESQYGCGARMGPEANCKHVCVVLYALEKAGGGIIYSETCTQRLHTFHHVKKHTDSPVKMEHFMLRSDGSLQRVLDLDPSPGDDMPDSEYETFSGV